VFSKATYQVLPLYLAIFTDFAPRTFRQEFMNPKYEPDIDDGVRGKERMIFPRKGEARWWAECFGRTDEEMNAAGPQAPPNLTPQTSNTSNGRSGTSTPVPQEPIVTGTESADGATGAGLPPTHAVGERSGSVSSATSKSPLDAAAALGQDIRQGLAAGIEKLGIGKVGGAERGASPASRLSADVVREDTRLSADLDGQQDDRRKSTSKEVRKEVEVEMQ
jgi:myotubularin-related protein 6/7/8